VNYPRFKKERWAYRETYHFVMNNDLASKTLRERCVKGDAWKMVYDLLNDLLSTYYAAVVYKLVLCYSECSFFRKKESAYVVSLPQQRNTSFSSKTIVTSENNYLQQVNNL
jgi:hypothetical protein